MSSQYSSRSVKSSKCDEVINNDRKEAVASATSHKALAIMKKRNFAGKKTSSSRKLLKEIEERSQTVVVVNTKCLMQSRFFHGVFCVKL